MPDDGTFVYTIIDSQTAAFGSTNPTDGNGFVKGTEIEGKVEIPSYIGAYKIIRLKSYSLRHCHKITELIFPDTLEYLEAASLTTMNSIKSIILPYSVTTLESRIDYLTSLVKFEFARGSRCTSIGSYFLQCSPSIEEITFPPSLVSIDSYLFYQCAKISRVVYCGNSNFASISNAFVSCPSAIFVYVIPKYAGNSFGGKSLIIGARNRCSFYDRGCTCKCKKSNLCNSIFLALFVIKNY